MFPSGRRGKLNVADRQPHPSWVSNKLLLYAQVETAGRRRMQGGFKVRMADAQKHFYPRLSYGMSAPLLQPNVNDTVVI